MRNAIFNIYGNLSTAQGLRINSGTAIINADCYAGTAVSHAVSVVSAISVIVNGTVYAGTAVTAFGLISTSTNVVVSNIEFTNSNTPVSGFVKFKNRRASSCYFV